MIWLLDLEFLHRSKTQELGKIVIEKNATLIVLLWFNLDSFGQVTLYVLCSFKPCSVYFSPFFSLYGQLFLFFQPFCFKCVRQTCWLWVSLQGDECCLCLHDWRHQQNLRKLSFQWLQKRPNGQTKDGMRHLNWSEEKSVTNSATTQRFMYFMADIFQTNCVIILKSTKWPDLFSYIFW